MKIKVRDTQSCKIYSTQEDTIAAIFPYKNYTKYVCKEPTESTKMIDIYVPHGLIGNWFFKDRRRGEVYFDEEDRSVFFNQSGYSDYCSELGIRKNEQGREDWTFRSPTDFLKDFIKHISNEKQL